MKKASVYLLLFSIFTLAIASCKKSSDNGGSGYKCTTCTSTPEGVAANDNSSKGIYKGVVIGSTGTIEFNIMNNGTTLTATMVIDGQTANLTSNITWAAGQPVIAPFTGTLNGASVTITFSVGSTGVEPTVISSNIPGHPNATFLIAKETSTVLIKCFEGKYHTTRPEDGTFNVILSEQLHAFAVVSSENGSNSSDYAEGTLTSDGKIKDDSGNVIGTLSGDEMSGSFKDSNGYTITFNGKRTK